MCAFVKETNTLFLNKDYLEQRRHGRQWSHLCLRGIKVFKRYALTMCVNVSHTNKQTFQPMFINSHTSHTVVFSQ